MSRILKVDFSAETPVTETYAGEHGEAREVFLEVIPEKSMSENEDISLFYVLFEVEGGVMASQVFAADEDIIVPLDSSMTTQSKLTAQLIAQNALETIVAKSPIFTLYVGKSIEGDIVPDPITGVSIYTQVADLELKKHWHENKSVLDKFSENEDGKPLYDGQAMGGASSWNDIQGKPTTLAGYGIANEVNEKIGEAIEYLEIASNVTHYAKYDGAFILGNRSRYHFAYNGYPITDIIQLPNGDPSRVTAICVYEAGSAGTPTAIVVKPLKLAVTVDNTKFIQEIELSSNFSDENFTTARKDKLDSIVFNKPVSAVNPLATVDDLTKPVEITDIPISLGGHISQELYDLITTGVPFTYNGYNCVLGSYDENTEYLKLYVFADDLSQINTDWQGNGYGVLNITAAGMKLFETTYFTLATSGELQKLDNIAFNQPITAQNKGATMADLVSKENLVYIAHINVVANQQGQLTITFATGYSYQTMRAAYDNGQKLALWIDSFNGANVYCYLTCDAYFNDHFYFTELIKQNSTDVYPYIFTVLIFSDHNSGRVDRAITADNLNAGIVPYSGSTTYGNGTVGKEIASLKSSITQKLDSSLTKTTATLSNKIITEAELETKISLPSNPQNGDVLMWDGVSQSWKSASLFDWIYKRVLYVKAGSGSYININVPADNDVKIEIDFRMPSVVRDGMWTGTFGTPNSFLFGTNNNLWNLYFGNQESSSSFVADTLRHKIILNEDKKFILDDVLLYTFTSSIQSPRDFYIGRAEGATYPNNTWEYYGVKVWKNNILIKNLIPCKVKGGSVGGFYDTLNNEFFGGLTPGPDV